MEYTETHGLRLSKLMLGTVQLGMPYGVANSHGQPTTGEAFALLDEARAGGVNCFDTAREYGTSEEVLGQYFQQRDPAGCTFVSKFKIDPGQGVTPADIKRQMTESVAGSLSRLGISVLPLLLAHNAEDVHRYGAEIDRALTVLKEKGLIQRAGVSVYDGAQIDAVLRYKVFEAVQLPINVFDLRLLHSRHLRALREAGYLVFARSVFLQGLFFMEYLPPGFVLAERFVRRLAAIAAEEGMSVAQMALTYVRDLPGITCLVLGAETVEQVRENLRLMDTSPLSMATEDKLADLAAEIPITQIMEEIVSRK